MENSSTTATSRKEDILARSRKANKDEGMEHARLKGLGLAENTWSVVGIGIAIFSFIQGQYTVFWALFACIGAFICGQTFHMYRFAYKKYYLAWAVGGAITTVFALAAYVSLSLGWIEPSTLGKWWGR